MRTKKNNPRIRPVVPTHFRNHFDHHCMSNTPQSLNYPFHTFPSLFIPTPYAPLFPFARPCRNSSSLWQTALDH